MSKFDYLNWQASQSKQTCDPSKNSSMSSSQKLAWMNNNTYKQNNGKYPDRLFR